MRVLESRRCFVFAIALRFVLRFTFYRRLQACLGCYCCNICADRNVAVVWCVNAAKFEKLRHFSINWMTGGFLSTKHLMGVSYWAFVI